MNKLALLLLPLALSASAATPGAKAKPSAAATAAKPKAAAAAPAGAMRAKPVHIEIDAPMGKNAPSDLGLDSDGGYAVTFLVRGTGITGIDKESLKISSATAGGADVSKDDRGRDAWSIGPFPRIADDGAAATFEVRVSPGAAKIKSAVPVLHGSIGVSCAAGREAKTATLATKPGSSAQLGPIKVAVPGGGKDAGADDANAGTALAAMIAQQAAASDDGDEKGDAAMAAAIFGGMFGGGGDGFDLEVSGDTASLASLVLVVDGKEVTHRSWMNFGRSATFGFPAVEGDSVRVKAEFWTGLRTETVSF